MNRSIHVWKILLSRVAVIKEFGVWRTSLWACLKRLLSRNFKTKSIEKTLIRSFPSANRFIQLQFFALSVYLLVIRASLWDAHHISASFLVAVTMLPRFGQQIWKCRQSNIISFLVPRSLPFSRHLSKLILLKLISFGLTRKCVVAIHRKSTNFKETRRFYMKWLADKLPLKIRAAFDEHNLHIRKCHV